MKNRKFFNKKKAKTNQRRETRREKAKEEKSKKKSKKEVVLKEAKKHSFSQKINAKRKNENIICLKREDTFFSNEKVFSLR